MNGISCTKCSLNEACKRCEAVDKNCYFSGVDNLSIDVTELIADQPLSEVIVVLTFLKNTGFTEFYFDGSDGAIYLFDGKKS